MANLLGHPIPSCSATTTEICNISSCQHALNMLNYYYYYYYYYYISIIIIIIMWEIKTF